MKSRLAAVLVVLLVWAVIYLPALGSIAIKGEEGRRILPAIRMLQTGNYVVPEVGGNPYFRKPPLVNWLVAASFRFFGVRNEWTARLPSAVVVLAVALAFVTVARASLGPEGSILAALIWMTNIGMMEKGRLIEIEALYVSLCGLAIVFLAEPFPATEISVAHLGSGIHFSRPRFLGERPDPSHIFLRDCVCRPLANERMAASYAPCAFRRASDHAGNLRGVGDSVLAQHDDTRRGREMVKSVHRPASGPRFQVRQLDSKYPAWSYLFSALGSSLPVHQVFKVSRLR